MGSKEHLPPQKNIRKGGKNMVASANQQGTKGVQFFDQNVSVNKSSTSKSGQNDSFQTILDASSKSQNVKSEKSSKKGESKQSEVVEVGKQQETEAAVSKAPSKEAKPMEDNALSTNEAVVKQEAGKEEIEEVLAEVQAALSTLIQTISQVLQISTEELEEKMQELGLDLEDLFTQSGMSELVLNENQLTEQVDLLSNVDASNQLKQLLDVLSEVKEELPIDEEELSEMIAMVVSEDKVLETVSKQEDISLGKEEILPLAKEESDVATSKETTKKQLTTEDTTKEVEKPKEASQESDYHSSQLEQNFMKQFTEALEKVVQTKEDKMITVDPMELVRQIVEKIKVKVDMNTTSMELLLNPESLGKVNLQVVSKNGVMTAQFTAETEAAKVAIESQLTVLKENLQNQGLKVEAIEVAVGTFEFNQSDNQSKEQNQQSASKKKLDFSELTMSEEEESKEYILDDSHSVEYMA